MSKSTPEPPNYYQVLGVEPDATAKQIRKAYQKKVLRVHPDKNPDNKRAAHEFHELQVAYEVLKDDEARAAFDVVMSAKHRQAKRKREMSTRRQRLQDELEAREQRAMQQQRGGDDVQRAQAVLRRHIAKIQRENEERMRNTNSSNKTKKRSKVDASSSSSSSLQAASVLKRSVEITWNAKQQQYARQNLLDIFGQCGTIDSLRVDKSSATCVYISPKSAATAVLEKHGLAGLSVVRADKVAEKAPKVHPYSQNYSSLEAYENFLFDRIKDL